MKKTVTKTEAYFNIALHCIITGSIHQAVLRDGRRLAVRPLRVAARLRRSPLPARHLERAPGSPRRPVVPRQQAGAPAGARRRAAPAGDDLIGEQRRFERPKNADDRSRQRLQHVNSLDEEDDRLIGRIAN